MDPAITNVDNGSVLLGDGVWHAETLKFAGADTFKEGTILARKKLSDTLAVTPDGGNTGDFSLAASPDAGKTLKAGTYVLTAGDLTAGVGPWTLTDPEGQSQSFTTSADADDLLFPLLGVTVAVTDPGGGTAFDDGDTADIVVSAESGTPLVPFDPAGTNGEQEPLAVLTRDYTRSSGGNLPIEALVAGRVNSSRLIIDVDGDGSNITEEHLDKLRAAGIVTKPVTQLAGLDNQP